MVEGRRFEIVRGHGRSQRPYGLGEQRDEQGSGVPSVKGSGVGYGEWQARPVKFTWKLRMLELP